MNAGAFGEKSMDDVVADTRHSGIHVASKKPTKSGVRENSSGDGRWDHHTLKRLSLSASHLKQMMEAMNLAATEEKTCPTEDVSWPAFNDLDSFIEMFKVGIGDGINVSRKRLPESMPLLATKRSRFATAIDETCSVSPPGSLKSILDIPCVHALKAFHYCPDTKPHF